MSDSFITSLNSLKDIDGNGRDFITNKVIREKKYERIMYKCNQCEFEATQKWNLITHKNPFMNVRYGCNQCEYKATEKRHLNSHRMAIH